MTLIILSIIIILSQNQTTFHQALSEKNPEELTNPQKMSHETWCATYSHSLFALPPKFCR
jgi:hypothetical protein